MASLLILYGILRPLSNLIYITITMSEQQPSKKTERILLDLNKNGLSYLTSNQFPESLEYLRQAERTVMEELKVAAPASKIHQLAGITYNNLACYYKKNNKPKVALAYLKKALQIEVYRVEDWTSTASTHLNICAIYSFLQKHVEAADHARLALSMLDKASPGNRQEQSEGEKSYNNIKMLSHYNLAIQLEHLRRFAESKQHYQLARDTATANSKNSGLLASIEQSLQRVNQQESSQQKKLLSLLAKKKQTEEKGNHEFMRKNKKNYGDQAEWRSILEARKYELYKTEADQKRHYQSTEKVRKLQPLQESGRSKRQLDQQ